jgi:transcriptional regulator EpsA
LRSNEFFLNAGSLTMQASEQQITVPPRPPQQLSTPRPRAMPADGAGVAALLDPLELESLLLNVDASLRVHARFQLFGWSQGMLQNLLRHEMLICALRGAEPPSYQVDCFAGPHIEPAQVGELFRRDTSLVPHLVKTWEESQYHPVRYEAGAASALAGSALAGELKRVGASSLLTHGTYDPYGRLASVFVFAGAPGTIGPRQEFFAELIVPFLHLAWMRTRINRALDGAADSFEKHASLLTVREQEILRWIHIGKSNIEIGTILGISPLTVKNHVQKILRKLNVQNRTQAVGKALALRILNL